MPAFPMIEALAMGPVSPLSAADYDAIESAVMETSRGRWFLAEYARRNRHADTEMLLTALARLEKVVRTQIAVPAAGIRPSSAEVAAENVHTFPDTRARTAEDEPANVWKPAAGDPLAPLAALTYEEKIALFT